jgi:hypothetical protein
MGGNAVNKSVPTMLGIVIILLVVLLVVVVYQYKLTQGLGEGGRVVGTVGGELILGVDAPEEEIGIGEVLTAGSETEPVMSPAMRPDSRASDKREAARERREEAQKRLAGTEDGGE